jgi:hypothetical protein
LRGQNSSDGRLRGDDDQLSTFQDDALEPDVVSEDAILERKPVEIFRGRGAVCEGTEGNAVALLRVGNGRLEVAAGTLIVVDAVFAATRVFRGNLPA